MILQRSLFWLLLLMLSVGFTACDDDDDDDDQFTEAELTIAEGWRNHEIETNLESSDIIQAFRDANDEAVSGITDDEVEETIRNLADAIEELEECEEDDVFIFQSGGKIVFQQNDPCPAGTPFSTSGLFDNETTWSLSGNRLTIQDSNPENGIPQFTTFTIVELDDDDLVLEGSTPITQGAFGYDIDENLVMTIKFKAQ